MTAIGPPSGGGEGRDRGRPGDRQISSRTRCRATQCGSAASGVAPYVSLYGARYSNEVLQRTSGLIGQKIRVYIQPNDMRTIWAYLSNGADLGQLSVLDGWRYSRHTLKLRKRILRERRLGRLKFVGEQDPVVLFAEAQRRAARGSRKRGTVVLQLDAASMSAENTPSPSSPFKDKVPIARATSPTSAFVDLGDLKMQNN